MAQPAFHIYKRCINGNLTSGHFTMGHQYIDWMANNSNPPNFGTTGMGSNKWEIANFGNNSFNFEKI